MKRKLLINGYRGGVSMTIVRLYQQKFAVSNLARPRSNSGTISGFNCNGIMEIRKL